MKKLLPAIAGAIVVGAASMVTRSTKRAKAVASAARSRLTAKRAGHRKTVRKK